MEDSISQSHKPNFWPLSLVDQHNYSLTSIRDKQVATELLKEYSFRAVVGGQQGW